MAFDFLDTIDLSLIRVMLDTAALILIWLVQLVIYPVFLYMPTSSFQRWHPIYTQRVTIIVLPIMLGQLMVYVLLLLNHHHWSIWANMVLVTIAWLITFFQAVPIHAYIEEETNHVSAARQLLKVNWNRTIAWSIVWLITMLYGDTIGIISKGLM